MSAETAQRPTLDNEEFFGHLEISVAVDGINEDKSERELFEEAVSRLEMPTTYDLYIDHAVDPSYYGERTVRCDRIHVPSEAYEDVEPSLQGDVPRAAEIEIRWEKAKQAAADWLSENVTFTGPKGLGKHTPSFHVDEGSRWVESGHFDMENGVFEDGHDISEGFDMERAIEQYDPTDAPWVEGGDDE